MNKFFVEIENNEIYKKLLKEPLTYVAGAVLLAVFQIAHFVLLQKGWGVTGPFATWGAYVYQLVGGSVEKWSYFAGSKPLSSVILLDGNSYRNLGIVFGALAATLFASQFKFKKIKSVRQIIAAISGGLLMGYGSKIANGCNIGALFTGVTSFSLSGWIFAAFLLLGAFWGSKLLAKYFI